MLSNQALNVGSSLVVFKDVWKPAIGEKLYAEQEPDDAVDKFAMKVVWVKRKLITWKNSWRARFADKHSKTQMAPLGVLWILGYYINDIILLYYILYYIIILYIILLYYTILIILIRFLRTPNTDVSTDKPHPWFLASILWKKVRLICRCLQYWDSFLNYLDLGPLFCSFPLFKNHWQ